VKEIWKPVVGYEGAYKVSNFGRVRNSIRDRFRKPRIRSDGYVQVNLSSHNRVVQRYVHHLVAAAFLGPRPVELEVCHNNGVRSDNRAINLRYDTCKANQADREKHGTALRGEAVAGSKLRAANVRKIRALRGTLSSSEVARLFSVCRSSVKNIWRRKTWRHV